MSKSSEGETSPQTNAPTSREAGQIAPSVPWTCKSPALRSPGGLYPALFSDFTQAQYLSTQDGKVLTEFPPRESRTVTTQPFWVALPVGL